MINVTQRFLKDWLQSLFMHAQASSHNEDYYCELQLTKKAIRDIKDGRNNLTIDDIKVVKIKKRVKGFVVR